MGFKPLVLYCRPVENEIWATAVENEFGASTPCATDSLVTGISHLVLLGTCLYRIWVIKKNLKLQRFKMRSNIYNYWLGLLAFYSVAEPLFRLILGISAFNIDGEAGLAPYESTAREVKQLDSITRSPVYAQFGEALNGLSSIRAYKAYGRMAKINGNSMDNNIRFTLVNMSANRWLAIRLETVGGLMIWLTATFAVMQNGKAKNQEAFASTMGLLLSYTLNITSLLTYVLRLASLAEIV